MCREQVIALRGIGMGIIKSVNNMSVYLHTCYIYLGKYIYMYINKIMFLEITLMN